MTETTLSPAGVPAQKAVKHHSHSLLAAVQNSTPTQLKEEPMEPGESQDTSVATPARQPSLDPLCGLESVPLLYSSSGPRLTPPNLFRPVLPTVRITKDTEAEHQEPPAGQSSPVSQHYPLHPPPILHSESVAPYESQYEDKKPGSGLTPGARYNFSRHLLDPSHSPGFGRQNISHHRQYDQGRSEPAPKLVGQFGHCPKVRYPLQLVSRLAQY